MHAVRSRVAVLLVVALTALIFPGSANLASAAGPTGTWYCGSPQNLWRQGSVRAYDYPEYSLGPFEWCASYRTFYDSAGYLRDAPLAGNSMVLRNDIPEGPLSGVYLYQIDYANDNGLVARARRPNGGLGPDVKSGTQATIKVDADGRITRVTTSSGTTDWVTTGQSNEYGGFFLAGIRTTYHPYVAFWFTNKDGWRYVVRHSM